jgi:uncharacterized protein YbjT (DUF2867 family)
VRGLTRHKDSAAAQKLATKGVEVVEAELDDVESLKKAFNGTWGVYGVTNYWEHGGDGETRHGKNMVDAAKFAGVSHFVYATMGIDFFKDFLLIARVVDRGTRGPSFQLQGASQ